MLMVLSNGTALNVKCCHWSSCAHTHTNTQRDREREGDDKSIKFVLSIHRFEQEIVKLSMVPWILWDRNLRKKRRKKKKRKKKKGKSMFEENAPAFWTGRETDQLWITMSIFQSLTRGPAPGQTGFPPASFHLTTGQDLREGAVGDNSPGGGGGGGGGRRSLHVPYSFQQPFCRSWGFSRSSGLDWKLRPVLKEFKGCQFRCV